MSEPDEQHHDDAPRRHRMCADRMCGGCERCIPGIDADPIRCDDCGGEYYEEDFSNHEAPCDDCGAMGECGVHECEIFNAAPTTESLRLKIETERLRTLAPHVTDADIDGLHEVANELVDIGTRVDAILAEADE